MHKLLYLFCFLLLADVCNAQQHITWLTRTTSEGDTSRIAYVSNAAGDSLMVDKSTVYRVSVTAGGVYFIANTDTLTIKFEDAGKKVSIHHDVYRLYPAYYSRLKQAVLEKHSVMALLGLLEDGIGDYPIGDALPLCLFTPQTARQIRSATIITQRSQADLLDTWNFVYAYNKNNKLAAVIAKNREETRFSKKVSYKGSSIRSLKIYRNLESRQETDRLITYAHYPVLQWHERVLEVGKNRESEFTVTLKRSIK
jgi:hypothetical protein